ncbi:MAG: AMIN domain-containing protein, partial [Merismopedia sp. SIO2A8]|nr:AMIN domain-containing protein [Merismopedia sp. SIO2A8]
MVKARDEVFLAKQRIKRKAIALALPLVGTFVGLALSSASALAAQLTQWSFDQQTQRLELSLPDGTTPQYFLLAQPPRIVIDLPNTQIGSVADVQTYPGVVRSIRVSQFQPNLARIVMELEPDAVFSPGHIEIQPISSPSTVEAHGQERWQIRPLIVGYEQPVSYEQPSSQEQALSEQQQDSPTSTSAPVSATTEAVPRRVSDPSPQPEASPQVEASSESALESNVTLAQSNVEATAERDPGILTDGLPPLEPGALELPVELLESSSEQSSTPPALNLPQLVAVTEDGEETIDPLDTVLATPESPSVPVPVIEFGQQLPGDTDETEVILPTLSDPDEVAERNGVHERIDDISEVNERNEVSDVDTELGQVAVENPLESTTAPLAAAESASLAIASSSTAVGGGTSAALVIPSGTVVTLRYPRNVTFALNSTRERQEVLMTTH